ncbi:MAG: response regulator [Pseudodesulfovibrio sp.]
MREIRVLHVDDETDFAAAVGKRLARRGVAVRSVTGGGEALEALASEPFDVVLLDIKMPGMDGIKVLGEIKQRHPLVEVIMFTAHANTDIVISSLAMGACDYLLKPADVDDLLQKIAAAADRRKGKEEAGA